MHSADIASAIKKAGSSASAIGRELDVSQVSVSRVINGAGRSQRIEERIAEITGLPLYRLWPEWHAVPPNAAQMSAISGAVDITLLGIIEQHLDRALLQRLPDLSTPFTIRIRHVAMVYNGVAARKPRADQMLDVIAEEVQRYVDLHDDPEGPSLQRVFLRDFGGAQATIAKERDAAPRAVINSGSFTGKQINLTGNKQTLVMGNKIKKQTVTKK